jgi:hypothetical protein
MPVKSMLVPLVDACEVAAVITLALITGVPLIVGLVSVLFVSVCVPAIVTADVGEVPAVDEVTIPVTSKPAVVILATRAPPAAAPTDTDSHANRHPRPLPPPCPPSWPGGGSATQEDGLCQSCQRKVPCCNWCLS